MANGGTGATSGPQALANLNGTPITAPTAIANLNLWLQPNAGVFSAAGCSTPVTNNSVVGCWKDSSPSGSGASYTASSNQPTYSTNAINSLPAVTFNGSTSGLSGTFAVTGNYYTMFFVRVQSTQQNYAPFYSEFNSTNTGYETFATDNTDPFPKFGVNNTNGNAIVAGSLVDSIGAPNIVDYRSVGRATANGAISATTDAPHIRFNGLDDASGWLANKTSYNATIGTTSYLGKDGQGNFFNGQIAEVIEYNRLLSNFEVNEVEQYLANKYTIKVEKRSSYDVQAFQGWSFNSTPIIAKGTTGAWDASDVTSVSALKKGDNIYAAYVGKNASNVNAIGLASGSSPTSLTKYSGDPLLSATTSAWDGQWVSCARTFEDPKTGKDYLYYCGSNVAGFEQGPANIGVAQCDFGVPTCTKYVSNPNVSVTAATWDSGILFRPWVLYNAFNDTYYMFHNGSTIAAGGGAESIGVWTATNPLGPWTAYYNNPVFQSGGTSPTGSPSCGTNCADPDIIQPNPDVPYWVMVYWQSTTQTRAAYSTDLLKWNFSPMDGTTNGFEWISGLPNADRFGHFFSNGTLYAYADQVGGGGRLGTLTYDPYQFVSRFSQNNSTQNFNVEGQLGVGTYSPSAPMSLVPKSTSATSSSMTIGQDLTKNLGSGGLARLSIGSNTKNSCITLSEGGGHGLLMQWVYSSSSPFRYGSIESLGGNNQVILQHDGGNVGIGNMTVPASKLDVASPIKTLGYTVSTLPTGATGMRAYVTDQTTACPAAGAALTGSGAVTCPVFYNGSAWVGD